LFVCKFVYMSRVGNAKWNELLCLLGNGTICCMNKLQASSD